MERDKESLLGKVEWDANNGTNPDSVKAKKYIIKLAIFLAHLRQKCQHGRQMIRHHKA